MDSELPFLRSRNNYLKATSDNSAWEVGDLIIEHLNRIGVDYVFGIPGGGIEPLYNALARGESRGGPKAIIARHETGAAFMADGYARTSGKLGVCCATTGPGSTNLITGISCAYVDRVPMLVITAQTSLSTFGKGAAQESSCTGVNVLSMFESCTVYNTLVSHKDQLEHKLMAAISRAFGNNAGPAHLSIPLDIIRSPSPSSLEDSQKHTPFFKNKVMPDAFTMEALTNVLSSTDKITFILGKDCYDAIPEIIAYAERRKIPLVTTPMGKGLLPAYHPLNFGVIGLAGHESARKILSADNSQYVIAIGTSLDENSTYGWDKSTVLSERLIHIDNNLRNLERSSMAYMRVFGSPKIIFQSILNNDEASHHFSFSTENAKNFNIIDLHKCKSVINQNKVKPQRLFWELSHRVSEKNIVTVDIGNSFLWGIHYWQCRQNTYHKINTFLVGMGFASMGWSIGAAVGAALAEPQRPVVCVTGDGSILMNGQEITTAYMENLNILFVILNDSAYGTVKHGQKLAKAEAIGYELPNINFAEFARSMGIESKRILNNEDFSAIDFDMIFNSPGPCVLDILIDIDETPPLGMRMKVLGTAIGDV